MKAQVVYLKDQDLQDIAGGMSTSLPNSLPIIKALNNFIAAGEHLVLTIIKLVVGKGGTNRGTSLPASD